jgi:DNA transformation protein and related proteins
MNDSGFVSHCLELLSPLGSTSSRRMFGGYALYVDGLCMALVLQDTLYLKVDDTSRALFERAGCRPFTYSAKNQDVHSLGYYTAPDEAMESPAEMLPWARRGVAAAVAARARAPAARKKAAAGKTAAKAATPGKAPARKAGAKKAPPGKAAKP